MLLGRFCVAQSKNCVRWRPFFLIDRHEQLECGPVDGYQQIASAGFIGYLRQIFDIHLQVDRSVTLEGLVSLFWGGGFECPQLATPWRRKHRFRPECETVSARNPRLRARNSSNVSRKCAATAPRQYLGRGYWCLHSVGGIPAVMKPIARFP